MTLQQAKDLYNEGDKAQGRKVLIAHLQATPHDDLAWAYLGAKCTNLGERKYCYLKALEIAYSSVTQERLNKLVEVEPTPPPELAARPVAKKQKPAPTPPPQKSRFPLILLGGLGFTGFCFCCFCTFIGATNSPKPTGVASIATPTMTSTVKAEALPTNEPTSTVTPPPTITPTPQDTDTPTSTPLPTATPTMDWEEVAKFGCKNFVKQQLKSPDSAEFEYGKLALLSPEKTKELYPDHVLVNPLGLWYVRGVVTSVNLLNVRLASDYICLMDYNATEDSLWLVDFSLKSR